MHTKEEILARYKTGFSSSPHQISNEDLELVIKSECNCWSCGKSIFEMDDFPTVRDGDLLCEDCEREKYYLTCDICENYFEKALSPGEEIIIISKEAVEEIGEDIKPGFYQVLKWPYFLGATGFGFEMLFKENISLIKELDINSMKDKLYPHNAPHRIMAEECCHECAARYTGKTKIINNYWDKEYGKMRVKLERKVIKEGK